MHGMGAVTIDWGGGFLAGHNDSMAYERWHLSQPLENKVSDLMYYSFNFVIV